MADINLELQNLEKEVTEIEDVVDSAVTFINGVAEMIREANTKNDPKFAELANKLDAKATALGAAIEAHSGINPNPTPEP